MNRYECIVELGRLNPVRYAESKEEFIENLLNEYNQACDGLFYLDRADIKDICEEPAP
jgi:hypothetical protein